MSTLIGARRHLQRPALALLILPAIATDADAGVNRGTYLPHRGSLRGFAGICSREHYFVAYVDADGVQTGSRPIGETFGGEYQARPVRPWHILAHPAGGALLAGTGALRQSKDAPFADTWIRRFR